MEVYFNGNKGAVSYRGVAFVGKDPVEVTQAWFEACKNPNIKEFKATKAPKKVELMDFAEE